MDYCDLGSSSDSDDERRPYPNPSAVLDSDEEERYENNRILKMLSIKSSQSTKSHQKIMDFEAEMEAELDRRASRIEHEGGMEHQRSLSRSSSSSSLNCLPLSKSLPALTGQAALSQSPGPSCLKRTSSGKSVANSSRKKAVNFAKDDTNDSIDQTSASITPGQHSSTVNTNTDDQATSSAKRTAEDSEFYDKIYFDSDESEGEEEVKASRKRKRELKSNDDLFYDPNSDAADQAWIDKQRRHYCSPGGKNSPVKLSQHLSGIAAETESTAKTENESGPQIPLPRTDAVLNCPACFSLLCMDCQRHEFYAGQYRAMFVTNCKIDRSETLTVPLKTGKSKGKGKGKTNQSSSQTQSACMPNSMSGNSSDIFFPVRCKVCNSQVAVYDNEEIYHFFNCLSSHP